MPMIMQHRHARTHPQTLIMRVCSLSKQEWFDGVRPSLFTDDRQDYDKATLTCANSPTDANNETPLDRQDYDKAILKCTNSPTNTNNETPLDRQDYDEPPNNHPLGKCLLITDVVGTCLSHI